MYSNFGSLEYSITKGFREKIIINFYIDHKLQTMTNIREGDRITAAYDFTTGEGMILRVKRDLPPDIKKNIYPKLNFSSANKHGKLKAWFDTDDKYIFCLWLPTNVQGEQVALKVTKVDDGVIYFNSGQPKTKEEIMVEILSNIQPTLNDEVLVRTQDLIRDIKNGKKLEDFE